MDQEHFNQFEQEQCPVSWLKKEFLSRKQGRDAYTLSAFAMRIGLSAGRLSEIFSSKRKITLRMGEVIAARLAYSPKMKQKFLELIHKHREKGLTLSKSAPTLAAYEELDQEHFELISNWYHYGILNLILTHDFRPDSQWIAKRLAISTFEVEDALQRLFKLGLIDWQGDQLVRTKRNVKTSQNVRSAAIKRAHGQWLDKAKDSLFNVDIDKRNIVAFTMPIDPSKIVEAKKLMDEFGDKLSSLLEEGERTEVYNLSLLLYPLSKEC
jgi:uncharacterized protein (TIGR02147 family)